ncbi:MAG: DUF2384 domain-containing protein [Thermotogaceae bacterium]|nr:DUF2384 domain-containing protein [Thermotogaceae bacterium]
METQQTERKLKTNKELKVFIRSFKRGETFKKDDITYLKVLKDKLLISRAVRRGVTSQLFNEIKMNSPFDDQQWSTFLNVNIRTLQRYRLEKNHVYKSMQSERIFELAEVISMGNSVFDSPADFKNWLITPSLALGREKPVNLLDNSYGKDLVIAELNRIEYGVFV